MFVLTKFMFTDWLFKLYVHVPLIKRGKKLKCLAGKKKAGKKDYTEKTLSLIGCCNWS